MSLKESGSVKLSKVHLYWLILVIVWLAARRNGYSAVMMCKILNRNVSDPAPSIVLVYDLNLNSVWVRSDVHPVSLHFDSAGADENVLKEASENWKLEVIKNLESRTSMQRDPICSWKGCCLNFSLYFQYIFNIYIYVYYIFPMISIHFIPDLYPLAHSKISKWPADQETTAWPHLEDL